MQGQHCLAHLTPPEWTAEIERLRSGERLDASRVVVSQELLARLRHDMSPGAACLSLPPVHFHETVFSGDVSFRNVEFSGDAYFGGAEFSGNADFSDARFSGDTRFHGARFSGRAGFGDARVSGDASFGQAVFSDHAHFRKTLFSGEAYFGGTRFSGDASFGKARFSGDASFADAQFSGDANFGQARFSAKASFVKTRFSTQASFVFAQLDGDATFTSAEFAGATGFSNAQFAGNAAFHWTHFSDGASFSSVRFSHDASFHAARFSGTVDFGPMVVVGTLDCDDAVFSDDVRMLMSACGLTCRRTRFNGRAELSVRWTEVALDDAAFTSRSYLGGVGPVPGVDDNAVSAARASASYADRAGSADERVDAQARPRLLSLRQANVENLALWNMDLRACRFVGAHGLDELRIEADCEFATPPGRWRTRRRTLAEEHDWRARRGHPAPSTKRTSPPSTESAGDQAARPPTAPASSRWLPPECQPAAWLQGHNRTDILDSRRIESLYRALRKAFEDRRNEPGAGDFYYGEMEMRRQRPPDAPSAGRRFTRDRGERIILTLYWLASGYGMRASRALACLAATVAVGALLFAHGGFVGKRPSGGPVAFALESAISLLRAPEATLTAYGEYVQIALRLLGPLFLGLALLALRGRVKR